MRPPGRAFLLQLLAIGSLLEARRGGRYRRQILPSQHVQVHSYSSNVSMTDLVHVVSTESQIDVNEPRMRLSTHSTGSELTFDSMDTFANFTAIAPQSQLLIQSLNITLQSSHASVNINSDRTSGHSSISSSMTGLVNLSVGDGTMTVEAASGKSADLEANTSDGQRLQKIVLHSNVTTGIERQLLIDAVSSDYNARIRLEGARTQMSYGEVVAQIESDYRTLVLTSTSHVLTLKTTRSPFTVNVDNQAMEVLAPEESARVLLRPHSSNMDITVGQRSRLEVDRGGGEIRSGSETVSTSKQHTEHITVDSNEIMMTVIGNNGASGFTASSNGSQITMHTNMTNMTLMAGHHALEVTGGMHRAFLLSGNVTMELQTRSGAVAFPTLIPPLVMPFDQFQNMGPVPFEEGQSIGPPHTELPSNPETLPPTEAPLTIFTTLQPIEQTERPTEQPIGVPATVSGVENSNLPSGEQETTPLTPDVSSTQPTTSQVEQSTESQSLPPEQPPTLSPTQSQETQNPDVIGGPTLPPIIPDESTPPTEIVNPLTSEAIGASSPTPDNQALTTTEIQEPPSPLPSTPSSSELREQTTSPPGGGSGEETTTATGGGESNVATLPPGLVPAIGVSEPADSTPFPIPDALPEPQEGWPAEQNPSEQRTSPPSAAPSSSSSESQPEGQSATQSTPSPAEIAETTPNDGVIHQYGDNATIGIIAEISNVLIDPSRQPPESIETDFPIPEALSTPMRRFVRDISRLRLRLRVPRGVDDSPKFRKDIAKRLSMLIRENWVVRRRKKRENVDTLPAVQLLELERQDDELLIGFTVANRNHEDLSALAERIRALEPSVLSQRLKYPVVDHVEFIPASGSAWIFITISGAGLAFTLCTLAIIYRSHFFRLFGNRIADKSRENSIVSIT